MHYIFSYNSKIQVVEMNARFRGQMVFSVLLVCLSIARHLSGGAFLTFRGDFVWFLKGYYLDKRQLKKDKFKAYNNFFKTIRVRYVMNFCLALKMVLPFFLVVRHLTFLLT